MEIPATIKPECLSEEKHALFVSDDGKIESDDSHIKIYSDSEDEIETKENQTNIDIISLSDTSTQDGHTKAYSDNEDEIMEIEEEEEIGNMDLDAPTQNSRSDNNNSMEVSAMDIDEEIKGNSPVNNEELRVDNSILDVEREPETHDKETQGGSTKNDSHAERVLVVCYDSKWKHVNLKPNDPNAIVIYHKKFEDIRVALYKGHEYISMGDQFKDETTWRCNQSKYCPALLFISKNGSEEVHLVSEHNCIEAIDTLKKSQFKKFKLANVIYYEGNSIPGLNSDYLSSLGDSILILCRDDKYGAKMVLYVLYDGYKYIKSLVTKNYYEYGCPSVDCAGALRLSRAGIDNKMVLKIGTHSCQQNVNKNSSLSVPDPVPNVLIAVTPINYRTDQELVFFLKLNELRPAHEGPPLIYVNEKSVYYQDFEYCLSASSDGDYICKTKACHAQIYITSDFRAVSIATKHICAEERDRTRSRLHKLIKVSRISDWKLGENADVTPTTIPPESGVSSKPGYVRVKYKYFISQSTLEPTLDPNDVGTVTAYFDRSTQRDLFYYKGYTYTYGASLQLRLCNKSASCAGALILRQESSEVMEMGGHTCDHVSSLPLLDKLTYPPSTTGENEISTTEKIGDCLVDKVDRPCSALRPIVSSKKPSGPGKPSGVSNKISKPLQVTEAKKPANKDRVDKLKYTPVKIRNCIKNGVRVAELDPNDSATACVYRDEAGRPVIYYKGYTYLYYSSSRIIYLCSKSRTCSAVLKPHLVRRYELAEIGEHNCFSTSLYSYSSTTDRQFESEPIIFRVFTADDFSQIPGFDLDAQPIVTMLVGDAHRHNVVYYRGNMYVDDRSLSCGRGKRLTRKSCNLLYMCVKSHVCSAGLSTNRDRTSALEVGLHSCTTEHSATDHDKLFRELKPVKICHSDNGKLGTKGIINAHTVETYLENNEKVTSYKGYTYMDRITACSHSVGCKCIYICQKRSVCSAALLVDAHDSVLEVGLHSCTKEQTSSGIAVENDDNLPRSVNDEDISKEEQRTTAVVPQTLTSPAMSDGRQSPDSTTTTANITPISSVSPAQKSNKRKRNSSTKRPKSKRKSDDISYTPVIIINHLKNMVKEVHREEQTKFTELDPNTFKFRDYIHTKKGTEGQYTIYKCIDTQLNRCSGRVLVSDRRVIWANSHSCQEIPRPGLLAQSNYLIVYYNENILCPEALYKGFTYLRKKLGTRAVKWTCSKNVQCKGAIHVLSNSLAELGSHTCSNLDAKLGSYNVKAASNTKACPMNAVMSKIDGKGADSNTKTSPMNAVTSKIDTKEAGSNTKACPMNAVTSKIDAKGAGSNTKACPVNAVTSKIDVKGAGSNLKVCPMNAVTSKIDAKEAGSNTKVCPMNAVKSKIDPKGAGSNTKICPMNTVKSKIEAKGAGSNTKVCPMNAHISKFGAKAAGSNTKVCPMNAVTSQIDTKGADSNAKVCPMNAVTSQIDANEPGSNTQVCPMNALMSKFGAKAAGSNTKVCPRNAVTSQIDVKGAGSNTKVCPMSAVTSQIDANEPDSNTQICPMNAVTPKIHAKGAGSNTKICPKNVITPKIDAKAKPKQKTIKAERLFMEATKRFPWSPALIPVLDEEGTLCVIYQGHIYFHSYQAIVDATSSSASDWMCTHMNCRATLHLDGAEVSFTSKHDCFPDVSALSLQHHSVQVIPTHNRLPLQVFRGRRKCIAYGGYVYQASKYNILKCVYLKPFDCRGILSLKNSRPIAVSDHSCRTLSSSDCMTEKNVTLDLETMACTENISVNEEVEEENGAAITIPIKSECDDIIVQEHTIKEEAVEETDERTAQFNVNTQELDDATIKEEAVEETHEIDESERYARSKPNDITETTISLKSECDEIIMKEHIKEEAGEETDEIHSLERAAQIGVDTQEHPEILLLDDVTVVVKEEPVEESHEIGESEHYARSTECDDITIKEEDVELAYAENHTRILLLDMRGLPDLVPFGAPYDHDNRAKLLEIDDCQPSHIPVHKDERVEENTVYAPFAQNEAIDFVTNEESIAIEEVEPIAICDDQSVGPVGENPLDMEDSNSNIEFVECPRAGIPVNGNGTILERLLTNPFKNVRYSGSEPFVEEGRLLAQNSLGRIQANEPMIPAGECEQDFQTDKQVSCSESTSSNSNYDDFEDLENFIPATVVIGRKPNI